MATLAMEKVKRVGRLGHANSTSEFARFSPRHADAVAELSASALRLAAPSSKALGNAGGVSQKRGSAWWTTGRGSPVYDCFALLYSLALNPNARPGAVIAHAKSLLHEAMLPSDTEALVKRFRKLMGEEVAAEGQENEAQTAVAWTGDLGTFERALMHEASLQEELAGICRELRRREINPYTWGK